MNSWDIIKSELTKKSKPGTFGRNRDVNQCAELFVRLIHNLNDRGAAAAAMENDEEGREAILTRHDLAELREAGVLR